MHWYYGDPGANWPAWILMVVAMALFWGGLITVVIILIRRFGHTIHSGNRGGAPERILAERFARGEIDEEEYRKRLDLLRQHTG